MGDPATSGPFGTLAREVAARKLDPHTAARMLIANHDS
jgi:hypothetical protein